jgi:hypothetical protein
MATNDIVIPIHNTFQSIVPLPELWRLYVLPMLLADKTIELAVTARINLRRVSQCHYEWDPTFVTPEKWQRRYETMHRIPEMRRALQVMAFVGWEWLSPKLHCAKAAIDLDDDNGNSPLALIIDSKPIEIEEELAPNRFIRSALFAFGVGLDGILWSRVDVTVEGESPTQVLHTINLHYHGNYTPRIARVTLRRFLRAMPASYRVDGRCNAKELDHAVMAGFSYPLPNEATPIFDWEPGVTKDISLPVDPDDLNDDPK